MVYTNVPCKHWNGEWQECRCKARKFMFIFQDTYCPKEASSGNECSQFVNSLPPSRAKEVL